MLFLTRKIGESIVISEDIYCTVLQYKNDEVCLAFDAPKSIAIHRDEIQRRIHRDQDKRYLYQKDAPEKVNIVDRLISKFKQKEAKASNHS